MCLRLQEQSRYAPHRGTGPGNIRWHTLFCRWIKNQEQPLASDMRSYMYLGALLVLLVAGAGKFRVLPWPPSSALLPQTRTVPAISMIGRAIYAAGLSRCLQVDSRSFGVQKSRFRRSSRLSFGDAENRPCPRVPSELEGTPVRGLCCIAHVSTHPLHARRRPGAASQVWCRPCARTWRLAPQPPSWRGNCARPCQLGGPR